MTTLDAKIKAARKEVNRHQFGTGEWETAMQVVRDLVSQIEPEPLPAGWCTSDGRWWQ